MIEYLYVQFIIYWDLNKSGEYVGSKGQSLRSNLFMKFCPFRIYD